MIPAGIAAFPKCYMDALCVHRTMSVFDWIGQAATLGVDGLELYPGFLLDLEDRQYIRRVRDAMAREGLRMPMLCAKARVPPIWPKVSDTFPVTGPKLPLMLGGLASAMLVQT